MQIFGTFNSIAHVDIMGTITIDLAADNQATIFIEYSGASKYRPGYIFSYPVGWRIDPADAPNSRVISLGSELSAGPLVMAYINIYPRESGGIKAEGKYAMLRPIDSGSVQISQRCNDVIYELSKGTYAGESF